MENFLSVEFYSLLNLQSTFQILLTGEGGVILTDG